MEKKIKTYEDYVKSKNYLSNQLKQIKLGLDKGLDVSQYDNSEYTWGQMWQIRQALKKGIDMSDLSPHYSYGQLELERTARELGFDASIYYGWCVDDEMLEAVCDGLRNGVDVSKYFDVSNLNQEQKYNGIEMEKILIDLMGGKDKYREYLNEKFKD